MGEKLQNLKPREVKGLLHAQPREAESLLRGLRGPPREAKPFTRMAKWEIRFQRFALSFRPSALGHCCFRFPLAFQPLPLAFAGALVADVWDNEKFHLSRLHSAETSTKSKLWQ
jgi:hypothetical protein